MPHAHILIFLHTQSNYLKLTDIDKINSCEIPNPELHPRLYKLVKQHMMHGPCGLARLSSPCMKNRRCSKFYPKKFNETTIVALVVSLNKENVQTPTQLSKMKFLLITDMLFRTTKGCC